MPDSSPRNEAGHQITMTWIERQGIHPLLFAFITLVIIFFLYQLVGGLLTFLLFGVEPLEKSLFGYRLATGVGQLLFILLPTVVLVLLASNRPKDYLRIIRPELKVLLVPIIGIVALQPVLQIYLIFQDRLPMPQEIQSTLEKFRDLFESLYRQLVGSASLTELSWVILVVALIPAFAEEFMFRGLIQRTIEKSLSPMQSVLVTGVIFAAYHLNPFSFIPLVAIGIYLGFIVIRSGSIWVPITAHFVNNALACAALYFKLEDDYLIVGNAGDMSTAGLLATFWFFGVIFLVSTMYFVKITKKSIQPADQIVSNGQERENKGE